MKKRGELALTIVLDLSSARILKDLAYSDLNRRGALVLDVPALHVFEVNSVILD